MPRELGYDTKNKIASVFDMEMFRNLEKNEKARICVLDQNLQMDIVHFIKGAGYVSCQGDYETVMRDGADPAHCFACKHATPGRDVAVGMPQRKFVTHILRYITNLRGEPLKPMNFKIQAWMFGNDKYNILVDRKEEHGDLRKKDLIITCTEKTYQRYDTEVAAKCLWIDPAAGLAQTVSTLFKEERRTDLGRLLGKTLEPDALKEAVLKAIPQGPASQSSQAEVLTDVETAAEVGNVEIGSLLNIDEPETPAAPAMVAPKKTAAPQVQEPPEEVNFDSLLNS